MTEHPYAHEGPELGSNAPGGPVAWVFDQRDLIQLAEAIRAAQEVVMDLETTGLDEHAVTGGRSNGGVAARVSIAALTLPMPGPDGGWDGVEPTTYVVPLSHPRSPLVGQWRAALRLIARTMRKHRRPFVNQHAKFDARWVYATTGVDIADLIAWDTQPAAHLIDETEPTSLKIVAPRVFNIPPWDDHDLSYPGASEEVDLWELGDYAARDTYWTWRLARHQRDLLFLDTDDEPQDGEEIADARLGGVARLVTMPTARSLCYLEQTGIRLDIGWAEARRDEQRRIASERLDWLADRYDLDRERATTASASGWFRELTEKAIDAGELRLAAMTAAGNAQWTKYVLGKQARAGSETARIVLEQRDAEKQAQFLDSWLEKVTPDGRIHASYRSGHVVTGRLSSADPNMQQVSKKLRPAFIPSDGYLIADLDYSQLELRIAAFIMRVEPMLAAYAEGRDLHSLLAADILTRRARQSDPWAPAVTLAEVTPEARQGAKSANFGLLYGQQAEGFRIYADKVYGVEFSEQEALEVYETFFQTWTGMSEGQQRMIADARRRGYALSPIGRRRNLPNLHDGNPYYRSEAERQAINAPVQGFGSDLMQLGLAYIYGLLPGTSRLDGIRPVATVHDSLVAEVEADRWQEIVAEAQRRMVELDRWLELLGCTLDVPLVAEAAVGSRWGLADISHPEAPEPDSEEPDNGI